MYILTDNNKTIEQIEAVTLKNLDMTEADLEEIIRKKPDIICDEKSLLIVGEQVMDSSGGKNDLVAMDQDGNIVLIELKRDKVDMKHRSEPLEVQAIRYAASCATISTLDELLQIMFIPYAEKHKNEFEAPNITIAEMARRKLEEFISSNNIQADDFNRRQRIILVASEFDERTLSATAWLCDNGVDFSCYRIIPHKYDDKTLLSVEKILPTQAHSDLYLGFRENNRSSKGRKNKVLPRIAELLEHNVVKQGDEFYPKNHKDEKFNYVVLQENGLVKTKDNKVISMAAWLQSIYGWSSVCAYDWAVHVGKNKLLSELREEYMEKMRQEDLETR